MTRDFHESVLRTIRRDQLVPAGAVVVVGCSGGPDSSALLRVLLDLATELDARPVAAHLDHALRQDSTEDTEFVRAQAEAWGVPFRTERLDWDARGGRPTANVEACAREARYAFLHAVAAEVGGLVAVGHHADDRVETMLAGLIRGAGPRGLSLPRSRREDGVIRPLLDRTRDEILAYLRDRRIPWRVDPTNEDGSNLRTRLRRDVIPLLRRENPGLVRVVGRTSALLADLSDFLDETARAAAGALVRPGAPGELVLDGAAGRPYHRLVLTTILRNAIRGLSPAEGVDFEPLDRLVRAWQAGGREGIDLPGGIRVTVSPERVVVAKRLPAEPDLVERELTVPGSVALDGLGATLRIEAVTPPPRDAAASSGGMVAWLDAQEVEPPLRLRSRRPGDRYRPMGLAGTAKVQDLMVDRKIPRRLRGVVPVLVDGRGILWIPGFRADARSRITERTRTALRIEISGSLPWLWEAEQGSG